LIALKRDVEIEVFLLAKEDKKALDNYVKNEQKQKHNGGKRSTNTSASASPQSMSSNYTFPRISIHVANN
jgi:hypothetical protein